MKQYLYSLCCSLIFISCSQQNKPGSGDKGVVFSKYADDRNFLMKNLSVVELHDGSSRVIIVPQYQARVMTSTCNGDTGYSFGWINYDLIQSKKLKEHINPYGGEERLWLAPEGGQFSFFFKKDVPYDFDHWYTPKEFDTEAFQVNEHSDTSALFSKDMILKNRSGNLFNIHIDRKISLLNRNEIQENIGTRTGNGIQVIAYESSNTIVNSGENSWTKYTGAPAIWLLGMLKPSQVTTIVLPLSKSASDTTTLLHDKYFGVIPSNRWKVIENHAFLKADGKFRGKVGIPPNHATNFIGSYDTANRSLTILEYVSPEFNKEFVNSAWEDQKEPFSGDVFNAYNDGPLRDGSQLGPFYELESLSPAAFLASHQSLTHIQITYHFQGDVNMLNNIAEKVLGVGLENVKKAFNKN